MNKSFEKEFESRFIKKVEDSLIDRMVDETFGSLERDHKFFSENPKIAVMQQKAVQYILKNYKGKGE